jgi:hypothetical protein
MAISGTPNPAGRRTQQDALTRPGTSSHTSYGNWRTAGQRPRSACHVAPAAADAASKEGSTHASISTSPHRQEPPPGPPGGNRGPAPRAGHHRRIRHRSRIVPSIHPGGSPPERRKLLGQRLAAREIFCGTSVGANLPNGTQEIFGIGLNYAVWTDWGTEARPSGWKQLSGPQPSICDPSNGRLVLGNDGDYGLIVGCTDFSGTTWSNSRGDGPNGTWSGWII